MVYISLDQQLLLSTNASQPVMSCAAMQKQRAFTDQFYCMHHMLFPMCRKVLIINIVVDIDIHRHRYRQTYINTDIDRHRCRHNIDNCMHGRND